MEPKELASQLRKPEGEKGIETGKAMNDGNKHMYALTYRLMDLLQGEKVLEIGFGNGKFIQELVEEKKVHYSGIDFSETMVNEAVKNNEILIRENKVEIKTANLSSIPYRDENFDKIFTINTLYFWENPAENILELKRVLKTGGKLFIAIRPKHVVDHLPFTKYGFTLYEAEDVKNIFSAAGFVDVKWEENDEPEFEVQGQKVKFKGICISGIRK